MTNLDTLHITCRVTGLQGRLDMPAIPRKTLEYTHPLAHIESAEQVLDEDLSYLRRLDKPILAAIAITFLRHHKLYTPSGSVHPATINLSLSQAKASVLLKLLHTLKDYVRPAIRTIKAKNIAHVSLDQAPAAHNKDDCNKWVRNLTTTLLRDVCGQTPNDTADYLEEAGEIAEAKARLKAKRTAEINKQIETRRSVRAELLAAKASKNITFSLEDLEETNSESTVSLYMKGKSVEVISAPLTTLYRSLLLSMKKSNALTHTQHLTLNALGGTLFTLEADKREDLVRRLDKYESKYARGIQQVLSLCGEHIKGFAVSMDVAIAKAVETKEVKVSLSERLAKLRGKQA